MPECAICGESLSMSYECSRCGEHHCSQHRLPENHDCPPVATGESERWFDEKFEQADETKRRRGDPAPPTESQDQPTTQDADDTSTTDTKGNPQSSPDSDTRESTSPSGRSMPDYDSDRSPTSSRAPGRKSSPTTSSPDVNPDGSIDRGSTNRVQVQQPDTDTESTLSRRAWAIILLVLLIPLGVGAGTLVMDPGGVGDSTNSNAAAGAPTETSTPTPTPTPDATAQAAGASDGLNVTAIRLAVHERVNQVRTARDLEALEYHDRTAESAQDHAEWMAEKGKFEHSEENQYLCRAGENIAYTYADADIRTDDGDIVDHQGNETAIGYGLVRSWMNSEEGHRENLLDDDNKFEGIGIAVRDTPEGTRVYAVQALCKS